MLRVPLALNTSNALDLVMWLKAVYERCENSCWPQVHAYAYMHGQVSKDLATFFRSCRCCLCAVQYDRWLKFVFRFFRITIIRVILFIPLNYWNLTIFLATGKSGELFLGRYFFKAKSLYSATVVCFFLDSISECNKHFFSPYCRLTTGILHSSHAINR